MKTLLFDTDIGADCDDAAALALLFHLQKAGACRLAAVTASSGRVGATATIRALSDHYGVPVPIGAMRAPYPACDAWDHYARRTMERYGTRDTDTDAVSLMRQVLSAASEPVTLVAVGPLTNMARLLSSAPDGISPLSGRALVEQHADCLYFMGGSFTENYKTVGWEETAPRPSWNIVQDIPAAQAVAAGCPVEMVYVPYEAGYYLPTHMEEGDSPVWFAMACFAGDTAPACPPAEFTRPSWDPLTAYAAVGDLSPYFDLSPRGRVVIDEAGATRFTPGAGRDRFLGNRACYTEIAPRLRALIAGR